MRRHVSWPRLAATLTLCVAGALSTGAQAAEADALRLRTGKVLDVESVRILDDRLNVAVRSEGALTRVELRFEQIDPRALLALHDRAVSASDAPAQLRGARLAFRFGLHDEAARRFVEAARLDPTLRTTCDEGLAAIRAHEATAGVRDLETRLRDGHDPRGAMVLAEAILDSAHAEALTAAQQRRVQALGALARRLTKRSALRALRAELEKAMGALPKPAPDLEGAVEEVEDVPVLEEALGPMEPVDALIKKALHAREEAADPTVDAWDAIRHLEVAARAFLDARRSLRQVSRAGKPEEEVADLQQTALDLRAGLVATYLDLADLYRQEQRFDEARAHVRAVLILEPGHEQAWTQRRLIEDDLRGALTPVGVPYRYTIRSPVFFGYCSPSPFYGWGGGCLRPVPYRCGGAQVHVRFGYRGHGPAVRRAIGHR